MFTVSAGYERFMGRWSRLLAPGYIAFAGVKNGDRVLDVGTGTGSLALAIEAAMPGSEIVGADPSEVLVASAQKHGKAIGEMPRGPRPHGVVSACFWDYNAGMQMLRIFWDEAVALDPAIEPKDERHMKLSREGQLAEVWKKTGLANVQEKPLVIDQAYESFEDYWGPFLKGAGPGGAYVVSLPEERRQQLEARMRKRLLGDRRDGGFALTARAWCVRGNVP